MNRIFDGLLIIFSTILLTIAFHSSVDAQTKGTVKIKMIFDDKTLTATMENNPTARDFISLLPLNLILKDYAGTEKVSRLPKKLSLAGAPEGYDPEKGDITLYSPWGNLAVFYRDFAYAGGLIKLGKIDSDVDYLSRLKEAKSVRIEVIKQ